MAISDTLRKIWETWDVGGFVLLSLFLQFFLLFFAPMRKRTKNFFVSSLIWLAYLLADTVAVYVVGLIAHSQVPPGTTNRDLFVFWTPFLLVHLGGPDTIAAYSLEDNELWRRHLLQFTVQVATTSYVFYKSLRINSKLLVPTLLIFLAGIIKYSERIRSLYLASLSQLRDSVIGQGCCNKLNDYETLKILVKSRESDSDAYVKMVKDSAVLFSVFKRFIVDVKLTVLERRFIREYFLKNISSGEEAFRIAELELNMLYEVLYTKVVAFHQTLGFTLRFVSFVSIFTALVVWCFFYSAFYSDATRLSHKHDVKITYVLLISALAMEIIGFIMLNFSDWIVGKLLLGKQVKEEQEEKEKREEEEEEDGNEERKEDGDGDEEKGGDVKVEEVDGDMEKGEEEDEEEDAMGDEEEGRQQGKTEHVAVHDSSYLYKISVNLLSSMKIYRLKQTVYIEKMINFLSSQKSLHILFGRWSQTIPQYDFKRQKEAVSHGSIAAAMAKLYEWLKVKELINRFTYVSSHPLEKDLMGFIFTQLREKSQEAATFAAAKECSRSTGQWVLKQMNLALDHQIDSWVSNENVEFGERFNFWYEITQTIISETVTSRECINIDKHLGYCQVLSGYMMYLVKFKPTLMPTVGEGISEGRFPLLAEQVEDHDPNDVALVDLNRMLPVKLLLDSLRKLEETQRWELISRVRVELLSYAAMKCRPRSLIAEASQGGELITFVWSLMTYLGLGKQFRLGKESVHIIDSAYGINIMHLA